MGGAPGPAEAGGRRHRTGELNRMDLPNPVTLAIPAFVALILIEMLS